MITGENEKRPSADLERFRRGKRVSGERANERALAPTRARDLALSAYGNRGIRARSFPSIPTGNARLTSETTRYSATSRDRRVLRDFSKSQRRSEITILHVHIEILQHFISHKIHTHTHLR